MATDGAGGTRADGEDSSRCAREVASSYGTGRGGGRGRGGGEGGGGGEAAGVPVFG